MDYQTTLSDWQNILNTMTKYNRTNGYINVLDNKLTFFDGNAEINGVSSFYVTISDVKKIIHSFA